MAIQIPIGSRVHHRGCLWNYDFDERQRKELPSWGWGTVLESVPVSDGTYEYKVRKDEPHTKGGNSISWWASYHIDRWEELVELPSKVED